MQTIDVPEDFKAFSRQYKDRVYNTIIENLPTLEPGEYSNIVRIYIDRRGQYRRPSYLLLASLLYGDGIEDAILPAAAQQISEDYFLMHDDIMDGNKLRRGGPAAHVLHGLNNAILGGDVVHAISWKIAIKAAKKLGGERGERYFDKFSDIMFMTHQGQYFDLTLGEKIKDITKFTPDDYYKSIHAKSAYYSVYGPMQCGAIVANQPDEVLDSIKEYGAPAGLAFQIRDDILDCTSTPEVLGKDIGTDVRSGTKTLILWHTVQNASGNVLNRLKEIYAKSPEAKGEEEIKWVLNTFNELGSISYAEAKTKELLKESIEKFNKFTSNIPESKIKQLARNALGHTALREK